MAGSSLFALIDDIATLLDDIAVMSKVAAKKTAGVLGDDLALNAQQVAGVNADRELPVVFAVAMGSLKNKVILVPLALLISSFASWAIIPLLMLGGAYLCYEGFEKIAHKFLHSHTEDEAHHAEQIEAISNPDINMVEYEKKKILGAIRTDFILSAEIIVIALGSVATAPFMQQLFVLSIVALTITLGVYGLVAGIVKLDDGGLILLKKTGNSGWSVLIRKIGQILLLSAPKLMKSLSVIGTIAMFMVGGSILTHGIAPAHHFIVHAGEQLHSIGGLTGSLLSSIVPVILDALFGIIAGACVLIFVTLSTRLTEKFKTS